MNKKLVVHPIRLIVVFGSLVRIYNEHVSFNLIIEHIYDAVGDIFATGNQRWYVLPINTWSDMRFRFEKL